MTADGHVPVVPAVRPLIPKVVALGGGHGLFASLSALRASVVSFGYKYGLPVDADLVADCRFLPNPRWVEDLAPLNGRDEPVREYVLKQPGATEFLNAYITALRIVFDGYTHQGKQYVTLAVGCTGGKHRSVAMAEQIASLLEQDGLGVQVVHRDLGRE